MEAGESRWHRTDVESAGCGVQQSRLRRAWVGHGRGQRVVSPSDLYRPIRRRTQSALWMGRLAEAGREMVRDPLAMFVKAAPASGGALCRAGADKLD